MTRLKTRLRDLLCRLGFHQAVPPGELLYRDRIGRFVYRERCGHCGREAVCVYDEDGILVVSGPWLAPVGP